VYAYLCHRSIGLLLQSRGHSDDVMSVASCPPNLLATASYDGEIIVWNMVSGHDCCHLRSPVTPELDESPGGSKRGHQHVIQLVRFLQYFHMS